MTIRAPRAAQAAGVTTPPSPTPRQVTDPVAPAVAPALPLVGPVLNALVGLGPAGDQDSRAVS
jgi:hypothetical protein